MLCPEKSVNGWRALIELSNNWKSFQMKKKKKKVRRYKTEINRSQMMQPCKDIFKVLAFCNALGFYKE